jgi:anthranilate synthase component 1
MKALGYDDYDRLSQAGGLVPVYREIPADLLTPVSAFLAVSARAERAFLLESVVGGERIARYSFLGRDPVATIEAHATGVRVRGAEGTRRVAGDLLATLRESLGRTAADGAGPAPFTGGAVGYLAYEAARLFERLPDRHPQDGGPLASFSIYHSLIAFDHVRQRLVLIADVEPGRRAAFERGQEVLDALEEDLRAFRAPTRREGAAPAPASDNVPVDGAAYKEAVRRAKEYIAAGDIFQVVLSRQRTVPCAVDPFAVYPRPAHGEPVAVHVLPQGRRDGRGRRLPGDAVPRRGPAGGDASPGRHAPARGHRGRGTRASRRSCSRTRRSAPST